MKKGNQKNVGVVATSAASTEAKTAGPAVDLSIEKVLISDAPGKKGRPSDPNSARAQRMAQIEAKRKLMGVDKLKQGRPSDPNSARAQRLAKIEAQKAAGTFKGRGRPMDPTSERQVKLAENAGKTKRIALKKGETITVNHPELEGMKNLHVVKVMKDKVLIQNGTDEMGYTVPKDLIQKIAAEKDSVVTQA